MAKGKKKKSKKKGRSKKSIAQLRKISRYSRAFYMQHGPVQPGVNEKAFRKAIPKKPLDVPYKHFRDHLKFGNEKLSSNIGIFNLGPAATSNAREYFCSTSPSSATVP